MGCLYIEAASVTVAPAQKSLQTHNFAPDQAFTLPFKPHIMWHITQWYRL